MKIIKNPATYIFLGLILGWFIFYPSTSKVEQHTENEIEVHSEDLVWTCSMHPQIQTHEEGDCPLCGMDLIPLDKGGDILPDNQILISPAEINNSGIKTIKVKEGIISKEISLQGRTSIDQSSIRVQSAHFNGRITRSFIDFSGQKVKKDDIIAKIYSPELITAQKEFIEAVKYRSNSNSVYLSSRKKLSLLNISEADINTIEKDMKVIEEFNIRSDFDGIVDKINITEGDYVSKGRSLYNIYSLKNIWFEFEIYEKDRNFVKLNDKIVIKINNGNVIHSTVDFIDPVSSINSSSTLLRSVVNNSDLSLRPGQYADGVILAKLEEEKLIVPKTAVLWTGKRSVAYVKIDSSIFELRNVTLGQESDDFYSIEDGLELDEKVVYKAVFTVDAASQLQGKKSMMNSDTKSEKSNVSNSEVNEHTNEIISLYLSLKDHLVDSNTSKSQKSAEEIHLVKSDIPGSFYDTKNGQLYLGITNKIKLNADKLSKATDLEEQREIFESISISMIELVESFDIENVENKLYVQHCPMAFDNKGADWISNSDKILNPYFGASMLRCGSVIKEY